MVRRHGNQDYALGSFLPKIRSTLARQTKWVVHTTSSVSIVSGGVSDNENKDYIESEQTRLDVRDTM